MKIIINTAIISILLLTAFNCNDSVVNPQEQPGRRDYSWTVDTVNADPYKFLLRLWASSPTDVWVTGIGGDFAKDIFHYDGNSWTTHGNFDGYSYQPHSIFGFAPNDIYIGCVSGRIYHYDGNSMNVVAALTKDGHSNIVFDNMWGDGPNNVYATGAYPDSTGYNNNSVIAHLTSGRWSILNTDGIRGIIEQLYVNYIDGKTYMQSYRIGGGQYPDSSLIYEYSQGKYNELYSSILAQGYQSNLSLINGKVYFILGSEIAIQEKDQFQTVLKVDNPNFYQRIWGRDSKDIFLMMTDGLAHYNGTDIQYLFHYPFHTQIFGAALFKNDVFFLIYESQTGLSLVYHGKLK